MPAVSKRFFGAFLIALVVACVGLIGCSSANNESAGNDDNAQNEEYGLDIKAGDVILDYTLEPGLAVTIDFKNTYSEALPFDLLYSVVAMQNGEELFMGIADGTDGSEAISSMVDVEPGASSSVQKVYVLQDDSPVTLEVRPNMAAEGDEVLVSREFNVEEGYKKMKDSQ